MTPDPACKFCQIAAGEIASYVVFEDSISLAFLDNRKPWRIFRGR
jgi:diadenosine tetraphosphate (Ap4A) HIT family hydrolase